MRNKGGNLARQDKACNSGSGSREEEFDVGITTTDISKKLDLQLDADVERVANGGGSCNHFFQNRTEFNQVLLKVQSFSNDGRCDDCRADLVNKRGKGKGKTVSKKRGTTSTALVNSEVLWYCLTCRHIGCGGGVEDSIPYGHARRHSKQHRHVISIRLDDSTVGWCLTCNSNITIEIPYELAPRLKDSSEDVVGMRNNGGDCVGKADAEIGYAVRGLSNLGNTCFFNSIMQNIFSIVKLREYFLNLTETSGPLTMSLKKLFIETNVGKVERSLGIVNPKNIFNCITSKASQFKGYQQQDSHELLRYLLDGLSTEETSARNSRNSFDHDGNDESRSPMGSTYVEDIFGGQLSNIICCLECGHTSVVHEPFLDLSLPVPSKKVSSKKTLPSFQKKGKFSREIQKVRKNRKLDVKNLKTDRPNSNGVYRPSETIEEQDKNQSPPSASEKSQYIAPANSKNQTSFFPEECSTSSSWLDFIEPSVEEDNGDLISYQNRNTYSQVKYPEHGGICQTRNYYQIGDSELPPNGLQKEQTMTSECAGETNGTLLQTQYVEVKPLKETDNGHRFQVDLKLLAERIKSPKEAKVKTSVELELGVPLQVQGAIGLPITENLTRANLESQESMDNTALVNNDLANKSTVVNSPLASGKSAEMECEGLGDLFAEPDSTSVLGNGSATAEDADTSCLVGASSESNPEEIDNASDPVSVDRCLVYYLKSELLTGDHSWHCENCSNILHWQKIKRWKQRKQAIQNDSLEETENIPKISTLSLDEKSCDSLENGKPVNYFMNERVSEGMMCRDSSELPENFHECSEKDGDEVVSDSSYYFSCTLNAEKTSTTHDSSCPDSTSCSRDELNYNEREVQSLADNMEGNCSSQLGNGTSISVQKMEANSLLNGMKNSEEKEPEMVMVKRDATKKILINKIPPVLTIHLVRFAQNCHGRLSKLNGHVRFSEQIDLTPYVEETRQRFSYKLYFNFNHT